MRHAAHGEVLTYGFSGADLRAENEVLSAGGVQFDMTGAGWRERMRVGIPGRFSIYNSLAAAGAMLALGMEPAGVAAAAAGIPPVAGRIEPLDTRGRGFTLLLDYAHTPDSLENVLRTARGFTRGSLTVVFGCGGDRDAGKRPQMGGIAAKLADRVFVTSDNPRFEDPAAIIRDIENGIPESANRTTIENRRDAIKAAILAAGPGDVVVLAGKGHEDYQEVRGVKHPFDEKVVVDEILDELGF